MRAGPARLPILCLVTDRRRACPGSDGRGATATLVAQAKWAAEAGIDLIQIRERDLDASALGDLVCEFVETLRGSSTRVVVNERLDVALASGADGVHLRGDSLPCARARALAPAPFLVGRSVHGVDEAATSSAGADYLIAGTLFATVSKPGRDRLLGFEGLREIAHAVAIPVLAIGGITAAHAAGVARAGASGIAAVGLFLGSAGPVPLVGIADEIRREFAAGTVGRDR